MSVSNLDTPELIPGYTGSERLGSGGYGEVWKVTAPGGLKKAIKVVYGYVGEKRAEREYKALDRIKGLRHPYLLSLERVEVIRNRLLIVTELADGSLMDRYQVCCQENCTGIPRDELLTYLREAAEALDYMYQQHHLQHLDIKPENLLLLCNHVKVADFGLVKEIFDHSISVVGGLTPVYAAPETIQGEATRWSDQYSLAVVYQKMLTGTLPFPGRTAVQLAAQHGRLRPRLSALPAADRTPVARALRLRPEDRFSNCTDFLNALVRSETPPRGRDAAGQTCAGQKSAAQPTAGTRPSDELVEKRLPDGDDRDAGGSTEITENICSRLPSQPSDSSLGMTQLVGSTVATKVTVSNRVRQLEPTGSVTAPPAIRPTLIIGIGGSGAGVLSRLRRAYANLPDTLANRAPQMLLLDTDRDTIERAMSKASASLAHEDCLLLRLRHPQEYRTESDRYLSWLSRRWLYNIPPSLETFGFRPLGRLAWFDHQTVVQSSVRQRLEQLVRSDSSDAHEDTAKRKQAARGPRVFIVGSVSGGTASGMMLDVAQETHRILGELGFAQPDVCGLLTHSTTKQPQQRGLALANAFATLSELRHLACYGETRRLHAASDQLEVVADATNPFLAAYFVHLGHDLSEPQFHQKLNEVAEYLYCNTVTPAGHWFDDYRHRASQTDAADDVLLRSFKLFQVKRQALGEADAAKLARVIQAARVPLKRCGFRQRRLLIVPQKLYANPIQKKHFEALRAAADVIVANVRTLLVCCEAEMASLAQIAHTLSNERPDIVEAAQRLHTRKDIAWSLMAQINNRDELPLDCGV